MFALDMRSYKGANSANRQPALDAASAIFGAAQLRVAEERAGGVDGDVEVVAADMPLGLVVGTAPTCTRRSPTVTPVRRSGASSRSRTC